jgi:membrane-bound metal-dependent hydrolase YbcI (DUF457 family)
VFIGHFALGYAAKRVAPRVPLPVLFGAAQCADFLWPIFLALGVEQVRIVPGETAFTPLLFVSYPYSHSLLMLVVWGLAFGFSYRAATGDRRAMPVLFALVVSHWLLDVATHRPDMPLWPGGPKYGFGLWYSVPGTVLVECTLFAVGVWLYMTGTRPRDVIGRWSCVGLVALFMLMYASVAGPPPPSVTAIWVVTLIGAALTLTLSWWSDRHRTPIAS